MRKFHDWWSEVTNSGFPFDLDAHDIARRAWEACQHELAEKIEAIADPENIKVEHLLYENGVLTVGLQHPFAIQAIAASLKDTITKIGGPNYCEIEVKPRDGGESFRVIVVRPNGKSPHELRMEAEANLARALAGPARPFVCDRPDAHGDGSDAADYEPEPRVRNPDEEETT